MFQQSVQRAALRTAHCYRPIWWLCFVVILLLLPLSTVWAMPVLPDPLTADQPNGVLLTLYPFGDEWSSGYEYQGYTVMLDPTSGYWVYAERSSAGRLIASKQRVGIEQPAATLLQHLRDQQVHQPGYVTPDISGDGWPGANGSHAVLVILVDFTPSVSRGTTDAQWSQLFFDTTAGAKTVRNYYHQASFDALDVVPAAESYGTANDGVVAVTLGYAHPNPYPTTDSNRAITRNALIAADPYVNFAGFDADGNGGLSVNEIHVVIIPRGYERSYGSNNTCTPNVWAHRWWLSDSVPAPTLDGVAVASSDYNGGYTQAGEWHDDLLNGDCTTGSGQMGTVGVVVHELGHDFNWPDLYDTDGSSEGVGEWSIMGTGSWNRTSFTEAAGSTPVLPDAFLKWYQHWITPITLTTPQTGIAVPNAAQNPVAYLLGANVGGVNWYWANSSGSGEYFLLENRQRVGFDTGLWSIDDGPYAKGCIIWHVDETRTSNNSANANETRRLLDVEEADGPPQDMDTLSSSGGNRGDGGDPWPGLTGETVFNATSNPSSKWYDGTVSGIVVSNISTAGTGCTVDFSGVGIRWNGNTSSTWGTASNWDIARTPGQNDRVIIPSGTPNSPNVTAVASAGEINLLNGAHMNMTGNVTLNVYGDWVEEGTATFTPTAGTVAFVGATSQTITANNASSFNHLQIGNGSTAIKLSPPTTLDINGNVTIQAAGTLSAGSNLVVGGNWTNSGNFVHNSGEVRFNSAASQTVSGSAVTTFHDVLVDAGSTVVMPSTKQPVVAHALTNNGTLRQTLTAGSSTDFLRISNGSGGVSYYGVNIANGSALGSTTVSVSGNQTCSQPLADAIRRCYVVNPTNAELANLTFYYTSDELLAGQAPNDLEVWKYDGSTWAQPGFSIPSSCSTGQLDCSVSVNGVSTYGLPTRAGEATSGPFGIKSIVPLAVTLADFNAQQQGNAVLLSWETTSELDNLGFNLYRSDAPDGAWTQLNAMLIPSLAVGSATSYAYSWTDQPALASGATIYYRLETIDFNGVAAQHGPISITLLAPSAVTLAQWQVGQTAHSPAWPWLPAATMAALALANHRQRKPARA